MIQFTLHSVVDEELMGSPCWINAQSVSSVQPSFVNGENVTIITFQGQNNYVIVSEKPEEVAKKLNSFKF